MNRKYSLKKLSFYNKRELIMFSLEWETLDRFNRLRNMYETTIRAKGEKSERLWKGLALIMLTSCLTVPFLT